MNNLQTKVILFSVAHFLVDLACAYLLFFRINGTGEWYLCILLYNFCAFALQMPAGLLADRWNRNAICAASGCVLVAAAYGCWNMPVAMSLIAGIGNCMFHVGGGIDILNLGSKKISLLGIFVAPGAFGLYLGTMYGKQGTDASLNIAIALLLTAVLILLLQYASERTLKSDNDPVSLRTASLGTISTSISTGRRIAKNAGELKAAAAVGAIACLFLVVCLRSYVGMTLAFPWKGQGSWGLILIFAVVLGKMAGGILADTFGILRTTTVSLGLSAILFLFSGNPIAGVGAVFLFNMTMPLTLWAVSRILPGIKGFTFGLLTFGLFLGFIPVYLGLSPVFSDGAGYASAAVISFALLCMGLVLAGAGQFNRKSVRSDAKQRESI